MRANDVYYGVGDNLFMLRDKGIDGEKIIRLGAALGAGTWRYWVHATNVFSAPGVPNEAYVARVKQDLACLAREGYARVIGMSHRWFLPFGLQGDAESAPARDLAPQSDYRAFLKLYKKTWRDLASLFPEILFWEAGNEMNMDTFLHPIAYPGSRFSREEKALITADMTFFARQGILEGNPRATVIFPGMSCDGYMHHLNMHAYMESLYEGIEKNNCLGGGNPADYFDAMAWHPYWFLDSLEQFAPLNQSAYAIVEKHHGPLPVHITEFGFTDYLDGEKDEALGQTIAQALDIAKSQLPFIQSFILFRMLNDPWSAEWAEDPAAEAAFGTFVWQSGLFVPKRRTKHIQKALGGTGDIFQFAE